MALDEWAFSRGLAHKRVVRNAFSQAQMDALRPAILGSPYLAENNLNYRFSGTRGFSVVFRIEGVDRVRDTFPAFAPYLDHVLDARCNAFFLNPLVLGEAPDEGATGARVAPHVDRSLRSYTLPMEPPNPRFVTVLYVEVPEGMQGGVLRLYHRLLPVGRVIPREGDLVWFQGGLRHEVTAVRVGAGQQRVSLVCEHYQLPAALLERIPVFTVRSTRGFEGFLAAEIERAARDGGGGSGG